MKLFNFDEIINNIKGYLESQVALAKLEIKEEVTALAKRVIVAIILLTLALFAGFFISFSLAFYLNYIWQSAYWGFVAVSILYVLVIVIILIIKDQPWLNQWIEKKFNTDSNT